MAFNKAIRTTSQIIKFLNCNQGSKYQPHITFDRCISRFWLFNTVILVNMSQYSPISVDTVSTVSLIPIGYQYCDFEP